MKKSTKAVTTIMLLAMLIVMLPVCSSCLLTIAADIGQDKVAWLNDQKYDSVEELHADFLQLMSELPECQNGDIDYCPYQIVTHFRDGTDVYIVCTFVDVEKIASATADDVIQRDELFVYIAKWDDGYYLEIPRSWFYGYVVSAFVDLHTDYAKSIGFGNNCCEDTESDPKVCYGFAYKPASDTSVL